jgi:hypothetical protein
MTTQLNRWEDVSGIANSIREDAVFAVRDLGVMQKLVTVFTDATGANPRIGYVYSNSGTVTTYAEADDMSSEQYTAAAKETLTPVEIGQQFFVTDLRAESDSPDHIQRDAARALGFGALDYVEDALFTNLASLTGGSTVGWNIASASAVTATWSFIAAAIAQARYVNKSSSIPLACVMHGYQFQSLAKTATMAGATSMAQSSDLSNQVTNGWTGLSFMGVPIYQSYVAAAGTAVYGGVFPREAIAIDWRRPIRVEAQRDASRRGIEFNMSAVFAEGVWRPELGVKFCFNASAPTGA